MMTSHPAIARLRQVVYTSVLSSGCPVDAVTPIMQLSRHRNLQLELSGALLFDGARFVQLLEGDPDVLGALMDRIERDPRHSRFQWIHDASAVAPRCCTGWAAGYVEADAVDAFESAVTAGSAQPLAAFMVMLAHADVI